MQVEEQICSHICLPYKEKQLYKILEVPWRKHLQNYIDLITVW